MPPDISPVRFAAFRLPRPLPWTLFLPSLAAAPGGDGFIVVWLEVHPANVALNQSAYCRLDGGLNPSSPALLAAPLYPITSPPMVRSGKTTTWITSQNTAWQVRGDGTLGLPLDAGVAAATDMTVRERFSAGQSPATA